MSESVDLLSLLYELSLTNLNHQKPEDTAKKFLQTLIARKNLQYGAVWKIISYDEKKVYFKKIYAIPSLISETSIDTNTFISLFQKQNLIIRDSPLTDGAELNGQFAYFKMGGFGLLELMDASENVEKISQKGLYPFMDVVSQFAMSLESGYAYSDLQKEIEQREIAERSMFANEEKFRRIIDSIKLGLLEVDNDHVIQHANKPFLDLVGYELDEIIGKKAIKNFSHDGTEFDKDKREENESKEDVLRETIIHNKNGEKKYVILSETPNLDHEGDLIGTISIHLDISKEQKLRQENKLKSAQLKKLFEKSLDALISINHKGEVFEWSPQAEKVFGYKAEEILGKKLSDTIIPHSFRDGHNDGMANYLKTGEGPVLNNRIEISALRKNGEEFPVELTIFHLEHDSQHYFTGFVRDITEIKKSKETMEKALLRQQELNEMKSQFISMTSHELRTPLTTIKNNTELANYQLENHEELNREKLTKNISRIEHNADRLNQLINNILMIGKLDSRKVAFEPQPIDAFKFVDKIILPDVRMRNHDVKCIKEGKSYKVNIDDKLFTHIIVNLVENAIKYSPGAPPPQVKFNFMKDQLVIDIQDFGMGIPEKDLEKLFDNFFRASNVGNIQGTGLGLYIVKEFIDIHNGSIKVESEVNKGTKFSIFLPK